jgi:hypothetical protein
LSPELFRTFHAKRLTNLAIALLASKNFLPFLILTEESKTQKMFLGISTRDDGTKKYSVLRDVTCQNNKFIDRTCYSCSFVQMHCNTIAWIEEFNAFATFIDNVVIASRERILKK